MTSEARGAHTDMDIVRYRYQKKDGTPMWIAFDPEFPCIYCDQPVLSLSMGGPLVCWSCDCGNHRDGTKWALWEAFLIFYPRANKRIEEMPVDPIWAHYELAYTRRAALALASGEG